MIARNKVKNKLLKDEKLKTATAKVKHILHNIYRYKLDNKYISRLELPKKSDSGLEFCSGLSKCLLLIIFLWLLGFGICYVHCQYLSSKNCVLELPYSVKSFFRPPEDCSICKRVSQVVRLENISAWEFGERYAEGMTPVIVKDATDGWKAINEFNFTFFADFYRDGKRGRKVNDCFYFAYKSGLNSLQEVFAMEKARANLSGEPWYVGWSTCYDEETRALRQYYSRPYFLPTTSESDMVDWIFMGGPGEGAPLHLDSVRHVSWQAQIRGRKRWQLAPPHECTYTCQSFDFMVAPTEILVVNTNRWYHSTSVLPGDISITIGAEFD